MAVILSTSKYKHCKIAAEKTLPCLSALYFRRIIGIFFCKASRSCRLAYCFLSFWFSFNVIFLKIKRNYSQKDEHKVQKQRQRQRCGRVHQAIDVDRS